MDRHTRHRALGGIGPDGVERIRRARVLVAGVGGLGCPLAQTLAAAGVGALGLLDPDRIEASNLARQPLYAPADVGRPKVKAAQDALARLNPEMSFRAYWFAFGPSHAALVEEYDVVVDCMDDLDAKLALHDACRAANIPLVHGAAAGWEGLVTVFLPDGPCIRCAWPKPEGGPSCADVGVFAPLVATLGSVQAGEALKLAAGLPPGLAGRLLLWDARLACAATVELTRRAGCKCTMGNESKVGPLACPLPWNAPGAPDIAVQDFAARRGEFWLLDVREPEEFEESRIPDSHLLPLGDLKERLAEVPRDRKVVAYCAVGGRSARATDFLRSQGIDALNLRGGIRAWLAATSPRP